MKLLRRAILLYCCLTGMVFAAGAVDINVSDAYVRGLPPSVPNTAAYMKIENTSDEDIVLTGASSKIAASVMLHQSVEENGQVSMHPVMSAKVPAHGELQLESGGLHLMLMGLKSTVKSGDMIDLTLQFQGGAQKTLSLPVRSVLDEAGH